MEPRWQNIKVNFLHEIFYKQAELYPLDTALAQWSKGAVGESFSTREVVKMIEQVAAGLISLGIKPGDKVAIIARNCWQWTVADHAILSVGAVNVPLYVTLSAEETQWCLSHAEVCAVFIGDREIEERLGEAVRRTPTVKHVFGFYEGAERHWKELFQTPTSSHIEELKRRQEALTPTSLATIIYTSGTTGTPKGVMLSHRNIVSNVLACLPLLPLEVGDRVLSFLPLNHVFERMMVYLYELAGMSIYFVSDLSEIGECARTVKPHFFAAVPRLLEKVYERILEKASTLPPIQKAIFGWALALARRYEPTRTMPPWYRVQHWLANRLVFRKWREALGGELKAVVVGGAALRPELARIFWAVGIPTQEGYGLTETSPVVSVNRLDPHNMRIGTVGPPIDNVEVRIAEDGEILVRGPNVMLGYYKDPEATREAIDAEGWFHTGDVGTLVEGKFLKITDRKKELFKTAGGKYIAPQKIENELKASPFIENAMVVGEGRKFPAVIISVNVEAVRRYAKENGLDADRLGIQELLKEEKIVRLFESEIERVNRRLSHPEQLKKFTLVADQWSVEGGELTPTLKLKRRILYEKYKDLIESLYAQP